MISEKFVILGVFINLAGTSKYIWETLKGRARPNRVSWVLWALAPLIAFAAEIKEGVGIQALLTFMVGFGPFLVLLGSFFNRKAVWRLTAFDYFCGGLSLAGLILWLLTSKGNLAIAFSITADALAALPTVVKSYKHPESESASAFLASGISAFITLLTVDSWAFAIYAFPLYIFVIDLIIFSLIQFKLGYKLQLEREETR